MIGRRPSGWTVGRKGAPRRDYEHAEQVVFMLRIRALAANDPRYAVAVRRTHAIPNGGGRTAAEGGRLKAEGVKPGVPDLFVAMPSGDLAGLYIEMKSKDGDPTPEQREWLDESVLLRYGSACCRGSDQALIVWRAYVEASFPESRR